MATHETNEERSTVNNMPAQITEASALEGLVHMRDQDDLERDIAQQAEKKLIEKEDERDQRRLEKTNTEKEKLLAQIQKLQARASQPGSSRNVNVTVEVENLQKKIEGLDEELRQIQGRIDERHVDESGAAMYKGETRREFLIRTGKITPFSKLNDVIIATSNLEAAMLEMDVSDEGGDQTPAKNEPLSHQNLRLPGFIDGIGSESTSTGEILDRATKRRKLHKSTREFSTPIDTSDEDVSITEPRSEDDFEPGLTEKELFSLGEKDESEYSDSDKLGVTAGSKRKAKGKGKKSEVLEDETVGFSGLDDGDEGLYHARLSRWVERRRAARQKADKAGDREEDEVQEWFMPHPTLPDEVLGDGYRIPGDIYPSLFNYQKTGVQWLRELHTKNVGGIIGDEMGLGKTIQIISFLACLHYSKKLTKPVLVVAPATLLKQWVNEFHRWWPPLRVSILHTSGSGMMNVSRESRMEDRAERHRVKNTGPPKAKKSAEGIVKRVVDLGHVLVTTYAGLVTYKDILVHVDWDYAILDEGHKIRNPDTEITYHCKQLRTHNRVILTGTPMQNNMVELWSLIDFVYPFRLGTLVNFRSQFEFPIRQGSFANASNLQVETARKCAEIFKDTISEYLLIRRKVDVAADLPKKTEQVLFCQLTKTQSKAYQKFVDSDELKSILTGRRRALYGIDILRKICNHPDLVDRTILKKKLGQKYGDQSRSGKMKVANGLLEVFKNGGHKTLLFCQGVIMLDIFEQFLKDLGGYNYRRMDGKTNISDRQTLVDEFNNNPDIHVFLLTTKVGGLGVNLTGASRVIIFDPDWNPSTDVQARERAWRLGQKKEVKIYRLLTAGTIEEKIYHRQVYKLFLTNKVLRDPRQRQVFHPNELRDLFTFEPAEGGQFATAKMFKGAEVQYGNGTPVANAGNSSASTARDTINVGEIAGVSNVEDYHGEDEDENAQNTDQDARIMEAIFAKAGVHAALEHDDVINGRKVHADPVIINNEVKRVAAEAAKDLKKSLDVAQKLPIGTPTWTGEVGIAGKPIDSKDQGRGALSSGSVLANLQIRQGTVQNGPVRGNAAVTAEDFREQICEFLLSRGGQARSQILVDHFNWQITSPQKTRLFQSILREVATMSEGGRRGSKFWKLKDEYKRPV